MDKNRIRRTATNLDLQSLIRRCDIAFDERARYVEFVCNVWNEGRFGPDLATNSQPASFPHYYFSSFSLNKFLGRALQINQR